MKKNWLFGLVVMLGVLMGLADLGFAACDCNTTLPVWYLPETTCPISPYFYKVIIDANNIWYDEGGDPETGFESGDCEEYWVDIDSSSRTKYACIPSTYSDPNDEDNIPCSLGGNGACYGSQWATLCDINGISITGSWDDETFTGSAINSYEIPEESYSSYYESYTTITPEFVRGNVPEECLTEPNVIIGNYQPTMIVRAKDECCCGGSDEQTITITCTGAAHMKATAQLDGELVDPNSTYLEGCEVEHSSSGSITIIPNHDKVEVEENQPKTQTVTYTVAFYDSAGNYLDQGYVSVTLTTECEEETK